MEILKGILMCIGGGVVVSVSILAIVIAGVRKEHVEQGTEDEQW